MSKHVIIPESDDENDDNTAILRDEKGEPRVLLRVLSVSSTLDLPLKPTGYDKYPRIWLLLTGEPAEEFEDIEWTVAGIDDRNWWITQTEAMQNANHYMYHLVENSKG